MLSKEYKELREKIINHISEEMYKKDFVFTCFLGGSDANNEVDNYSDIDLFLIVGDDYIDLTFTEIKVILSNLGEIDFESQITNEGTQTLKFFHIKGTPESLIIDIGLIKKSTGIIFELDHPYFKPKIIFDKENIISYKSFDKEALEKKLKSFILEQKDLISQSSRIQSYIKRGNYIEATNYYIKFLFLPLVGLLRVKYTPTLYNWGRIHISRHFSQDVIFKLEKLVQFNNLEDLENNFKIAKKWVDKI